MTDFLAYLFHSALNKSLKTIPLILVVLLLRMLLKRAPKKVRVWLWGIAALGLMLPLMHIPSPFSLTPSAVPVPETIAGAAEPKVEMGIPVINNAVNGVLTHFAPQPESSVNPLQIVEGAAAAVWAVGIVFLLLYAVVSTVRLRFVLRSAKQDDTDRRVRMSNACPTPFILGLFPPMIYLPENLSADDRSAVLAHERAHIKRGDHIWKLLGFLLVVYYWFDPLVWLGYHLLSVDIEYACDERVIADMDASAKKSYANALLRCSLLHLPKAACPLAFGEVAVKKRIASVADYQPAAKWKKRLAALTVPLMACCFLTDPMTTGRFIPEKRYFEMWIFDQTPVSVTTNRVCAYEILDSDWEPFYDRRNISYHYVAVLVQEYTDVNGEQTVVHETFSPVCMAFKGNWLLGYADLSEPAVPGAYNSTTFAANAFSEHFPDADGAAWQSCYDALAAECSAARQSA